jgi:hypothetical protein
MEPTESLKCPSRANSEIFDIALSDGCPTTANLLSLDASLAFPTRVLRFEVSGLRRRTPVRPVLLTGQTGLTHRSDRSGAAAPPSSVIHSWVCGSTKEPSGFLVNHRKPRELGVASANRHSCLGSHVVPTRSWFWGSTKKPSMTSSCCSCHHAACIWLHWPPGPSNQAYLSSPHQEASPAMTFRTCSSPAPTPVKPQPAPVILSQEFVHTTLSITHHTRKRPSTSPQTTHGFQSPPWWVHWQHTHIVTREKRKRKKLIRRNSNKRTKAKERQGERSL